MNENFSKLILFIRKWRNFNDDQKKESVENLLKNLDPAKVTSLIDEVAQMVKKFGL